jgi:hypothetical protein
VKSFRRRSRIDPSKPKKSRRWIRFWSGSARVGYETKYELMFMVVLRYPAGELEEQTKSARVFG